jgi:GlpG protein
MPQFLVSDYSAELNEQVMIVGLSGILYGLFAFTWATRRYVPEFWLICDARIVQLMLAWLVICIVATRLQILPVANTAHVCGLLFGGMYGLSLYSRYRWQWLAASITATLLVLATMLYAPGHNGYEYTRQIHQTMLQKMFGD